MTLSLVPRARDVLSEPVREPLTIRLRLMPGGAAYVLEVTHAGRPTPATVSIPVRR